MTRYKRIILRISVFLLLFLLVATLLSRTVYRLLLPQVDVAKVQSGSLNTSVTYRTAVGDLTVSGEAVTEENDNAAEEDIIKPEYTADLGVSFDELKKLLMKEGFKLSATAEPLLEDDVIPVDITLSGYDYDSLSGRYIAHFILISEDKPLESGLPLTITVRPVQNEKTNLVPLSSVFTDFSSGMPQYCVYALLERQTMWGKETYVQKQFVTLVGSDYQFSAVQFANMPTGAIACYPSRPLNDGDAVIIKSAS